MVARAVQLPPGDYDAVRRGEGKAGADVKIDPKAPPAAPAALKAGILQRDIDRPGLRNRGAGHEQRHAGQRGRAGAPRRCRRISRTPTRYIIGGRCASCRRSDGKFAKAGELIADVLDLRRRRPTAGKPDVQVEYTFHQKADDGEKYFNKTHRRTCSTPDPAAEFNLAAGHQLHRQSADSAGELPGRRLPAGDQDHRQAVGQGRDAEREFHGRCPCKSASGAGSPLRPARTMHRRRRTPGSAPGNTMIRFICRRLLLTVMAAMPYRRCRARVRADRAGACGAPRHDDGRRLEHAASCTAPSRTTSGQPLAGAVVSAARRQHASSPSPTATAASPSAACPPVPIWFAPISRATPRRAPACCRSPPALARRRVSAWCGHRAARRCAAARASPPVSARRRAPAADAGRGSPSTITTRWRGGCVT